MSKKEDIKKWKYEPKKLLFKSNSCLGLAGVSIVCSLALPSIRPTGLWTTISVCLFAIALPMLVTSALMSRNLIDQEFFLRKKDHMEYHQISGILTLAGYVFSGIGIVTSFFLLHWLAGILLVSVSLVCTYFIMIGELLVQEEYD